MDRGLDLSWLRDEVAALYCADKGRPRIDPDIAVRLMLAGFLLGIPHRTPIRRRDAAGFPALPCRAIQM